MATYSKRALVTLRPEWESDLAQLKKERFYGKTQAEMFRYLISLGLGVLTAEQPRKPPENHPM